MCGGVCPSPQKERARGKEMFTYYFLKGVYPLILKAVENAKFSMIWEFI